MAFSHYEMGEGQCHMPKGAIPFHSMFACTYKVFIDYQWWYVFQSYDTPIAMVYRSPSAKTFLGVNFSSFDCSRTTARQFSKWLFENNLPSYSVIKKALYDMVDGEVRTVGCVQLFRHTDKQFRQVFNAANH